MAEAADPDAVFEREDDDDDDDARRAREPIEGEGRGVAAPMAEEELATKMLQIQSKRFYLDVKQNWRGRFIKIAEVGAGGRKSRLLMSMSAASQFRDYLTEFGEYYASLGPANPESVPEDGQLKSEVMVKENRRYYLDLKENNRGRFLRVTQSVFRGPRSLVVVPAQGISELRDALANVLDEFCTPDDLLGASLSHPLFQVTQTAARGPPGQRAQVAVPAQGIIELRDGLEQLLDQFGTDDGFQGELPEGRQLRVENKMFYFDTGQNNRGIYMRISEVKSNFRTAITIPERSWTRFRDVFIDMCDQMASQQSLPPHEGTDEGTDEADPAAAAAAVSDDAPAPAD